MEFLKLSDSDESGFLLSALTLNGEFHALSELEHWLHAREVNNQFKVDEIKLGSMNQWDFDSVTGNLQHDSGQFYKIEGIRVKTNFGNRPTWEQAIINQPEIGILGIITKKFSGITYFLMQAKMEPGNINISQFSPTVQATKSNYTQVHKGRQPLFLEYFLEKFRARIIVDQLQSEQGGAFLRKRNRNIIVETEDEIELPQDFCWLTLGQIKQLASVNDLINMDARSVISCIQFIDENISRQICGSKNISVNEELIGPSTIDLLASMAKKTHAEHSMQEVLSWFTEQKIQFQCDVEEIGLNELDGWTQTDYEITNKDLAGFSVNAVDVKAGNREVRSWNQPLVKNLAIGDIGFITQKRCNVLNFLVQARVEPGFLDTVELSPTVSSSSASIPDQIIPYIEYFKSTSKKSMRLSVVLSEEGGRFYKLRNRYMVIELAEGEQLNVLSNYIWMSLGQIMELIKHSGYVSVEMRSLISILKFL